MEYINFKELIDSATPELPMQNQLKDRDDLKKIYSYYKIEEKGSHYSTKEIQDAIISKIKVFLTEGKEGTNDIQELNRIKNSIFLKHYLKGHSLDPYYFIAEFILNNIRTTEKIKSLQDREVWKSVFKLIKELFIIIPSMKLHHDRKMLLIFNNDLVNLAEAAKFYNNKGYKYEIKDGSISFTYNDIIKITEQISNQIKAYGGTEILFQMLNLFKPFYNYSLQRFIIIRRFGQLNQLYEPDIPLGFIYNLCVKNLNCVGSKAQISISQFKDIIKQATMLCALFQVQNYNQYSMLLFNANNLPKILSDSILYDNLFTVNQFKPKSIRKILNRIFVKVDRNKFSDSLLWDIDDGIKVISTIIERCADTFSPKLFSRKFLYERFPYIHPIVIDKIIDAFSIKYDKINIDYKTPNDYSNCNNILFPFILLADDTILVTNSSIIAFNAYECLIEIIKNFVDKDIHDKIGYVLEDLVRNEFNRNNIPCKFGKYLIGDWECDAVIETSEYIFFIEIKKKSLTAKSKSGSDLDIFLDLSKGLIKSITQLNNHEIQIRKNDILKLKSSEIPLNNRKIEKIALTLTDYGFIQDRIIIQGVLNSFLTSDYNTDNPAYIDEFKDIKVKIDILRNQFRELQQYYSEATKRNIIMNFWFLSVPQLLMILNDSNSPEAFKTNLFMGKYISFSTHDFYCEYTKARDIKK